METERETIEIITPIKNHKVILKSYIVEKELKKIKRVWNDYDISMGMEQLTGEQEKLVRKGMTFNLADKMDEAENIALELMTISIDGETENISEILNNMRPKDFAFVKGKINEITKGDDFLDKPKSDGSKKD